MKIKNGYRCDIEQCVKRQQIHTEWISGKHMWNDYQYEPRQRMLNCIYNTLRHTIIFISKVAYSEKCEFFLYKTHKYIDDNNDISVIPSIYFSLQNIIFGKIEFSKFLEIFHCSLPLLQHRCRFFVLNMHKRRD